MTEGQWRAWLVTNYPNLLKEAHEKTSDDTPQYNCIAWAASENFRWWWPQFHPYAYWPSAIPNEVTSDTFTAVFNGLGYEPCDDGRLEDGYEKVVIYELNGKPTHMARQEASGTWTSKLGPQIDIRHATPQGIENGEYGTAVKYMKRRLR